MKNIKTGFIIFSLLVMQSFAYAQNISDYLILNDIGIYKLDIPAPSSDNRPQTGGPKVSEGAGVLSGADHFPDHSDKSYEVRYTGPDKYPSLTVQVTQHTGGDSDKWLPHELDAKFRDYYGEADSAYAFMTINGNTVLVNANGGRDYRWLSGNKVITLEYNTQAESSVPEPLEIVQAYLAKHPSTLPSMTLRDLRGNASIIRWVKDEMDRRLWICDKWYTRYNAGQITKADLIHNLDHNMGVFINYRHKYYGVDAANELRKLKAYIKANNFKSILNKLTFYETWWKYNREKRIILM